jgi:hypothetical protein
MNLATMLSSAVTSGWSAGVGDLEGVTAQARQLKLEPIANRRGEPPVSRLRPTTEEEAKPHSLSAQVGLGAQPLHTDGAHQESPPDFLVFVSERPSRTPTWLRHVRGQSVPWDDLRGGMFLVGTGSSAFFAPALKGAGSTGRLRFDPGCMTPCDARARVAAKFLSDTTSATRVDWTSPGQILVLDNSRTLHGRGEVHDEDLDRELVRIAFRKVKT